jgi:hypothetical protein
MTGPLPLPVVPDFIGHVEARLARDFAAAIHDWSDCLPALTQWEDEHLLDNPTPELLARHKALLQRLVRFGQLLALTAGHPDFAGQALAQIVAASQRCYRDKLAMWHGQQMNHTEADRILSACFPE